MKNKTPKLQCDLFIHGILGHLTKDHVLVLLKLKLFMNIHPFGKNFQLTIYRQT